MVTPSVRKINGILVGKYHRKDPVILTDVQKLELRVKALESKLGIKPNPNETVNLKKGE